MSAAQQEIQLRFGRLAIKPICYADRGVVESCGLQIKSFRFPRCELLHLTIGYGLRDHKAEDGGRAAVRPYTGGLCKPCCPAAGSAIPTSSTGDETGPGDAHCREEGRVGRTVLGSAVGSNCGAGFITGNALT